MYDVFSHDSETFLRMHSRTLIQDSFFVSLSRLYRHFFEFDFELSELSDAKSIQQDTSKMYARETTSVFSLSKIPFFENH